MQQLLTADLQILVVMETLILVIQQARKSMFLLRRCRSLTMVQISESIPLPSFREQVQIPSSWLEALLANGLQESYKASAISVFVAILIKRQEMA